MHHNTIKIQLLAHSLTSYCFSNNCAEYTSYLSTDDLIAFFKDHSLVVPSQIYPFRNSHSSLLTSIYGSSSLKIPMPSSLQSQSVPPDTARSTSVRPPSPSSGGRVNYISPQPSCVAESAVDSSALPTVPPISAVNSLSSVTSVPAFQSAISTSSIAVGQPLVPSMPLMEGVGSPIPPSSPYRVTSPIPFGSPVPPSAVLPSAVPLGSPVPPSAVPPSAVPLGSPVPPSAVPLGSPVPPSKTTLTPLDYSTSAPSSAFYASVPTSFRPVSYHRPTNSFTVRPSSSSAVSDRPSAIVRPMSASNSLTRKRSCSIPQMDISTGMVIPESISIPITSLTPKHSPKPQEERKGIEDYLSFPPTIQLDVKTLDSQFDSKDHSQISRADFVSLVVSTDPKHSSVLSTFARDVFDALAIRREETVDSSLLFGVLSLFENTSFADRCEVFLFDFSYCRVVFASHSTIQAS